MRQFRLVMVAARGRSRRCLMPSVFREFETFRTDLAYLATFTRVAGLLLGAVLATVWTPWRWHGAGRRRLPVLDAAGFLALVGTRGARRPAPSRPRRALRAASSSSSRAAPCFRGLFGAALLAVVAVAAVVHPGATLLHRAFGSAARRDRAADLLLYLWHWPIFVLLRAEDARRTPRRSLCCSAAAVGRGDAPVRRGAVRRGVGARGSTSWRRSGGTQRRDLT